MDLLQTIAAAVIIVLAVVVGACLAALWHSSRPSRPSPGREERRRGSPPARPQRREPETQAGARRGPSVAGASPPPGGKPTAPGGGSRMAEAERLKRDRPAIQAAISRGDAKALYALASEYQKQGFEHAAHELLEKAKWIGTAGEQAGSATSPQNRGGATTTRSSTGTPEERRPR